MKKICCMAFALFLIGGSVGARPQFEDNRVTVFGEDWQYTQILTYDYSSGTTGISDVDHGERTTSRDLTRDGYIGFFLYDYSVAAYTEEAIVGHTRF